MGFDVDLIVTYKDKIDENSKEYLKRICSDIYYVQRLGMIKSAICQPLKLLPLQIKSRTKLKNVPLSKDYDYILCESEYVFSILSNPNLSAKNKLLRVHNDEVVYYNALFNDEINLLKKIYYFYEMFAFKYNKKNINSSFDKLLFISKDECDRDVKGIWLPSHMPIVNEFKEDKFDIYNCNVLFVGNLFMPNNLQGLIWYLKKVHPKVLEVNSNIKLTIAGNAKNGISQELKKAINAFDQSNINLVASPDNDELQNIYDRNCIFINPMLNGAGVKLKNLDAMRNSMFVVSTSVGAEGTGVSDGKELIIANEESIFAKTVIDYSRNTLEMKKIASDAFCFIKNNYDSERTFSSIFKEN